MSDEQLRGAARALRAGVDLDLFLEALGVEGWSRRTTFGAPLPSGCSARVSIERTSSPWLPDRETVGSLVAWPADPIPGGCIPAEHIVTPDMVQPERGPFSGPFPSLPPVMRDMLKVAGAVLAVRMAARYLPGLGAQSAT